MFGLNPSKFLIGGSDDRYNSNAAIPASAHITKNITRVLKFAQNELLLFLRLAIFALAISFSDA